VIATKVCEPMAPGPHRGGLCREAIFTELDASLRRLGTDYIDLYQIHRKPKPDSAQGGTTPTAGHEHSRRIHRGIAQGRIGIAELGDALMAGSGLMCNLLTPMS
jgi:aryl-alcohol dehydrogenase-like predicted oxidoreductase